MDNERDIVYIINKVNNSIDNFIFNNGIDNLKTEPQQVFSACLMSAGRDVFARDFFVLDRHKNIIDIVLIDKLIDYYIYIAKLYNKISSVYEFCNFTGIRYKTMCKWNKPQTQNSFDNDIYNNIIVNDLYNSFDNNKEKYIELLTALFCNEIDIYKYCINNNISVIESNNIHTCYNNGGEILTALQYEIFSKLHIDREQSLTNRLINNQNAIGTITAVNKEYAWNVQQVQQITQARALSLSELPKLDNI